MNYNFNGRNLVIPDSEIENNMKILEVSKEEAVKIWLEDNEYEINEEQKALNDTAKTVKINHGATNIDKKRAKHPKTVKISEEKAYLFEYFTNVLEDFCATHDAEYTILTNNKLFELKYGNHTFKIDLIQKNKPKK